MVIDSQRWLDRLPESVEAIFYVDCAEVAGANTKYFGSDGRGTAATCEDAKANAISAHRSYLRTYHLDEANFPLLKLRPENWEAPFAVA